MLSPGALPRLQLRLTAVGLLAVAVCLATLSWARPAAAGPASPPDLTISKTDSQDPVLAGEKFFYTVTVSNIGGSTAGTEIDPYTGEPVGVLVIDALPQGFSLTEDVVVSGDGVCDVQFTAPPRVTCQFGPFTPGQVETIVIGGMVAPGGNAHVANGGLVDLPVSRTAEQVEVANNVDTEDTEVLQPPTATPTATATVIPTLTPTVLLAATGTSTPRPPSLGGVANYPDVGDGENGALVAAIVAAVVLLLAIALWRRQVSAG